ncbi:flagellar hook protein FlgE [Zafaria cholistanensis]|uniref:Flagellar hook protein FlgE n=1 Tax=Zafaria cholistanensis TaxID=1682741 RepID=A0A5A7NL23_9MICC|nr:flagellar hook protein FlgE [Zafaria cholistanensis]GER21654.1 flagellar hook protein FlgE [Zafaria cholistanensis]
MLRSLYSGISGLRSHQTMLDVTGNNIANVNTTGFKSSSVVFQDTLSQMAADGAAGDAQAGGTNPAQVGLGVQVAAIATNTAQGSLQPTGKATDVMIAGEGYFVVSQGGQQYYTRAGGFEVDDQGRLKTPSGALLQGWPATNGVVDTAATLGALNVVSTTASPAVATAALGASGNLPDQAAPGTVRSTEITVYDETGAARNFSLEFTRTAYGWDVAANDGAGNTATTSLAFSNGVQTQSAALTVGGATVDLSAVTGYSGLDTAGLTSQDGRAAGMMESFSIGPDGTVTAAYSNGARLAVGRIALADFANPGGLEKAGDSLYRATGNSGAATLVEPGANGASTLASGYLEMSNVDLSQEFTNLIVAQRGFQANARIITTSDDVLQELTNLKR